MGIVSSSLRANGDDDCLPEGPAESRRQQVSMSPRACADESPVKTGTLDVDHQYFKLNAPAWPAIDEFILSEVLFEERDTRFEGSIPQERSMASSGRPKIGGLYAGRECIEVLSSILDLASGMAAWAFRSALFSLRAISSRVIFWTDR